jgi:hypothetical protein
MNTGIYNSIDLEDAVDADGDMEMTTSGNDEYISRSDAIDIIHHMRKVFKITDSDLGLVSIIIGSDLTITDATDTPMLGMAMSLSDAIGTRIVESLKTLDDDAFDVDGVIK